MSSYLLAYLVSNFNYIENDSSNQIYNVPFRVYSRPSTQDNAVFALDFGERNMVQLENYTNFPYALPKIDKVAVPDFAAGAMENWGLVVYRYVCIHTCRYLAKSYGNVNRYILKKSTWNM